MVFSYNIPNLLNYIHLKVLSRRVYIYNLANDVIQPIIETCTKVSVSRRE